jgi:hypothetical protein
MIAPIARIFNQEVKKNKIVSNYLQPAMVDSWRKDKSGPEILNVASASCRKEQNHHWRNNKANDDYAASLSSDKDPSKMSDVAYYNSLPFSP